MLMQCEYLPSGSSQSRWIHVTDWKNASMIIGAAPISAQITSWGTDVSLLIMQAIIDTKGNHEKKKEIYINVF